MRLQHVGAHYILSMYYIKRLFFRLFPVWPSVGRGGGTMSGQVGKQGLFVGQSARRPSRQTTLPQLFCATRSRAQGIAATFVLIGRQTEGSTRPPLVLLQFDAHRAILTAKFPIKSSKPKNKNKTKHAAQNIYLLPALQQYRTVAPS